MNRLVAPSFDDIEKLHGPIPKPGRNLTEEEASRIVKRLSPRRHGKKGEQWAKQRLQSLMGASLKKNTDEMASYEKDGQTFHYYASRGQIDYSGTMRILINGVTTTVAFEMEVKSFQGSYSLSQLPPVQMKILDKARSRGQLALIALVEREKEKIVRGWFIPWRKPGDRIGQLVAHLGVSDYATLITYLQLEAKEDKRFQGKSMRQKDQVLLTDCLVEKVSGRWRLCPWLERIKPLPETGQTNLF